MRGTKIAMLSEGVGYGASSLAGIAGLGLAAAASHTPNGEILMPAALVALTHAPMLLLLGHLSARPHQIVLRGTLVVLVLGLLLFCGDLAVRAVGMPRLFPGAAPLGGIVLMIGWGGVALAGLARLRAPRANTDPIRLNRED